MTCKIEKLILIHNRFVEYRTSKIQNINNNVGYSAVSENDFKFKIWLEQQYDINNKLIILKFQKYLPSYIK
jgi:hypothetical protein